MNTRPLFFAAGHCISAGLTLRPARPPGRRFAALALLGLMLISGLAAAQPLIVRDIHFAGNRITQPSTLLRELKVRVGDAYDDAQVEASRQAIQDLGLFRSVAVDHETVDSGIELTFTVAEKWYLQAYPRLSANSDGQNSVGAELRWSNLWGLNHSLRMLGRSRDSNDADRGREQSYRARYSAPFLLGNHVGLRGGVSHSVTPFIDPAVYDETLNEAELLATYALGQDGSASQGWTLSAGPLWRNHQIAGNEQVRAYGTSYALVTQLDYRRFHNQIFSDQGQQLSLRYEVAGQSLGSDYSYALLTADWNRSLAIGMRAHQTLDFGLRYGLSINGLSNRPAFALGGNDGLRGFDRRSFEGQQFYLAQIQFMRPLIWDSLRGTIGLEMGNAVYPGEAITGTPHLSLNAGLRLRPRRLVNFEVELGIALPLNDGGSRFYADKVGDR
ncbi:POTRA domain-containing protein [Polycyclovorans algicola]|uniref:POTRA domain-containing protein n=1 Tax=Polycyclovorans algicola TaxID=616992 RepID=UPI0012689149|nr:POTRA domain-containing protein [Polycyclovorans algicola]